MTMVFTWPTGPDMKGEDQGGWQVTHQDGVASLAFSTDVLYDPERDARSMALYAQPGGTIQVTSTPQELPPEWSITEDTWRSYVAGAYMIGGASEAGDYSEGTALLSIVCYGITEDGEGAGTYRELYAWQLEAWVNPTAAVWRHIPMSRQPIPNMLRAGTRAVAARLTWVGSGVHGGTVYVREPQLGLYTWSGSKQQAA